MSAIHTADAARHDEPHVTTIRFYVIIYVTLLALMTMTVVAAKFDMGQSTNFAVAMGIATVKMVLILLYFMHIRYSDKLTWVFSSAAFLWLIILIVGTLNDYFTRDVILPGK